MMPTPRFTVLTVTAPGGDQSYVVVDTQTGHIVQGAYQTQAMALGAAAQYEEQVRAVSDCILCTRCETVTTDWVCWSTTYVEHFAYFCSNACMIQWLLHLRAQTED
jgi:hypothetical protein